MTVSTMSLTRILRAGVLSAFVSVGTLGLPLSARAEDLLTIGSVAPALDIEHWVQNGEGKFPKVTKFNSGKVYIVEFWATWCGPCVASMPHLAELQKKYADKGVQVVSISNEKLDEVKEFLEKETGSDDFKTFNDLTKSYCLTTDPDGSCNEDYMDAARQNGIPCAFIVGKDSKIEWIGHPMEIDEPIKAVVEGSWDREKFGAEFREKQVEDETLEKLIRGVTRLEGKKQFSESILLIDEALDKIKSWDKRYGVFKKRLELQVKTSAPVASIESTFDKLFELARTNEPLAINDAAWSAYEMTDKKELKSKKTLESAIAEMKGAIPKLKQPEMAPSFLDTLAHLQFITGDLKGASESQKKAIASASEDEKSALQEFAEEIDEALAKQSKAPKK